MKKIFNISSIITTWLILIVFNISAQTASDFTWAKQTSGSGIAYGFSTAIDNAGNIYVTGEFSENAFDPIIFPNTPEEKMFLAKYEPSGNLAWVRMISGIKGESDGGNFNLDVDDFGNVIITAAFGSYAYFDGFTLANPSSEQAVFIAKYNSDGDFIWAQSISSYLAVYTIKVLTDSMDNIFLLGMGVGSMDITIGNNVIPGNNGINFLIKLDPIGSFLWGTRLGEPHNNSGISIHDFTIDSQGDLYVAGELEGTATFGNDTLSNPGNSFMLIAKYSSGGTTIWANNFSAPSINEIEIDANGNLYTQGFFSNSFTLENITVNGQGDLDIYLASFNNMGVLRWLKQEGGPDTDFYANLNINSSGQCFLYRPFTGTTYFGTNNFTSDGIRDALITSYNESGDLLWGKKVGGTGDLLTKGITVNGNNCVITGFFSGNAQFGNFNLNAPSGYIFTVGKLFLARLGTLNSNPENNIAYSQVNAFPNPAENTVTLTYSLPTGTHSASIHLSEIATGRKVHSVQLIANSTEAKVNIQNLPSGMYSYTLVVNGAQVATKKLAVVK